MFKSNEKEITLNDGCKLKIKSGKIATRADGAVEVRYGNNVLLSTVVFNKSDNVKYDFLPLHVDYQEKFYAIGRIPAGCKRELRLNDHEVLVSRLIDRCIRPCFDRSFKKDTQVNVSVLSADDSLSSEYYSCFSASLALLLSNVDFNGPVSEVFLYYIENNWVINPKKELLNGSEVKLVIGGNENSLLMCEGFFNTEAGLTEDVILDGIVKGLEEIKNHCILQKEFLYEFGIVKNNDISNKNDVDDSADIIESNKEYIDKILEIYKKSIPSKGDRDLEIDNVISDLKNSEQYTPDLLKKIKKEALNRLFNEENKRIDGRKFDEIRHISCDVDYLPSAHGSALFTRGETQALVTVTLGDKKDEQPKEEAFEYGFNKLILHYNFPSFCVGELSYSKNVGRREIGHGNLALNGLKAILPDDNMFTIRIVSDILSSNGSSSMATVCGSCLALKDAGIQIKHTISGIAMGLFYDKKTSKYTVLSDISSDEDELGDMDFKIIGTEKGITGIQLDVKFLGLNIDILKDALKQARDGVNYIIKKLDVSIQKPRVDTKDFAPHFTKMIIDKKMLGYVIGSGGSNIQNLQKDFNCAISINGNVVSIISKNKKSLEDCVNKINTITIIPDKNSIFDGVVKKVQENSALVEFLEGKIGVLKKEELDLCRVDDLTKVLLVGDRINVKILEIQDNGRYILSHKVLLLSSENSCKESFNNLPAVNIKNEVDNNINKNTSNSSNNNNNSSSNNINGNQSVSNIESSNNIDNNNKSEKKVVENDNKKGIIDNKDNNNKVNNNESRSKKNITLDNISSTANETLKNVETAGKKDNTIKNNNIKDTTNNNVNENNSHNIKTNDEKKHKKRVRRVLKIKLSKKEAEEDKKISREYRDQIPDNI